MMRKMPNKKGGPSGAASEGQFAQAITAMLKIARDVQVEACRLPREGPEATAFYLRCSEIEDRMQEVARHHIGHRYFLGEPE